MQSDRNIRVLDHCCLNKLSQISSVCILSCACGNLQDNRGLQLASCLSDSLNDLHVVYVESTDSVTALIGFLKHLCCCN